ncbi:hypothetical protein AMJ40_06165 [candidate division TA06 bacterium DG_26]|uniref:Uncharacterized protein n=1 Tax=candidate division TA06 bacterium DG_26 TaxID=1703771 RepID=A0A0S7WG63_UNCT6|nr:MAG: hypothetical protein AMJ40_06165 [candidate division TA06 bacterium DG_26]
MPSGCSVVLDSLDGDGKSSEFLVEWRRTSVFDNTLINVPRGEFTLLATWIISVLTAYPFQAKCS